LTIRFIDEETANHYEWCVEMAKGARQLLEETDKIMQKECSSTGCLFYRIRGKIINAKIILRLIFQETILTIKERRFF